MLINKPLILSTGTGAAPAYTIDQSIRFNSTDEHFMYSPTPSSSKSFTTTATISMWIKLGNIGQHYLMGAFYGASNRYNFVQIDAEGQIRESHRVGGASTSGGTGETLYETTQVFRDPSAWYHLVFVYDSTNAVQPERFRLYVNGSRVTDFATSPDTKLGSGELFYWFGKSSPTILGSFSTTTGYNDYFYWDGYMAEVHGIDGTALEPSNFGEYNSSNIWIPKEYSGSYGTDGFYIKGADANSLGTDSSGNGKNFTLNAISPHDKMADSPSNNFAVLSSISNAIDETLTNGNLQIAYGSAATRTGIYAPYGMTSGKWYWEVYHQASGGNRVNIGISSTTENDSATRSTSIGYYPGYTAVGWSYFGLNGNKINNGSASSYGDSFAVKDIIGVAYDADNGNLFFYKNGAIQNSGTAAYTGLSTSETYFPAIGDGSQAETMTCQMNFGQDSTFAGLYTQSNSYVADSNNYVGASDGNGVGSFFYTPPTGYLALCTKNLGS